MDFWHNFLQIFNTILVVIMTFLSIDFVDGRRKGFKKVTTRGWVLILLGIMVIVTSFGQQTIDNKISNRDNISRSKENNKKDSILRAKYDSSLLTIQNKFDTSNQKTISIVSETLGKYGFRFDSVNKELMNYTTVSMNQGTRKLIRVSNLTKAAGATDWSEFKDANVGDVLSISFTLLNTGPKTIKSARLYLKYENFINISENDTTNLLVLTAILRPDNIGNVITDNAYFRIKKSASSIKLTFNSSSYSEISVTPRKIKENLPFPFNQTGSEVLGTGFLIENLLPNNPVFNTLVVRLSTGE